MVCRQTMELSTFETAILLLSLALLRVAHQPLHLVTTSSPTLGIFTIKNMYKTLNRALHDLKVRQTLTFVHSLRKE